MTLLLRATNNGRLPLIGNLVLKAINQLKAEKTVGPRAMSIQERIQCALEEAIYPALLEAVHRAPPDGPSPEWAIRVISSVCQNATRGGEG
jgi:hypothetical protein